MTITRVDCYSYRGDLASSDTSSYALLNPAKEPGALVLAGACAARESISSQVACRLSLEHFVDGVLDFFSPTSELQAEPTDRTAERALEVLESAFRNANSSVYSFGHKLAAGGRMAASLIGLVLDQGVVAAGRVGNGGALLIRGGEIFPFFEDRETDQDERHNAEFVGANSLVSVELASVPVQENDSIFLFSGELLPGYEAVLIDAREHFSQAGPQYSRTLCEKLFPESKSVPFSVFTHLGPETFYLSRAAGT